MVYYSEPYKGKEIVDRIMITCWLAYLFVNVVSHNILQLVGGLGNIIVIYGFFSYFFFIYGTPCKRSKLSINKISILGFCILYAIIMQTFYDNSEGYQSFGVTFNITVWNLISFVPSALSAVAIIEKTDKNMRRWIKTSFLIIISVICIYSIGILSNDYSIAKQTATGHGEYIPLLIPYSTVYGLAVILPFLMLDLKKSKRLIFSLLFLAFVVITILSASFLIAIGASIVGIIAYFFLGIKRKFLKWFLLFSFLGVVFYSIVSGVLEAMVVQVAEMIPMKEISMRLFQILEFSQTGEAVGAAGRFSLYSQGVKSVLMHPLTGNAIWNNETSTGHSTILDVWGECGIFVFGLLFAFFFSISKYHFSICSTIKEKAAVIASGIALFFVSFFNPILASPNIGVLWIMIPLLYISEKDDDISHSDEVTT